MVSVAVHKKNRGGAGSSLEISKFLGLAPNRTPVLDHAHLNSRQRDRDMRNVGCSGGVDRDQLAVGLGRYGQIRGESDTVDLTANSRAGDCPGEVADRIACDLIPIAGEPSSRRGDLASDIELVAVARTTQGLLERRAVRCHVVMRLAAKPLTPCRRLDGAFAGPIAGKSGKSAAFALLCGRRDRQENQTDRQRNSLHAEDATLRKYA
jgi:hypothetical protein